jgi:NitT/TauT family transport system substrate-binding protein
MKQNKIRTNTLYVLLVAVLVIGAAFFLFSANLNNERTIKIGYKNHVAYAPLFVGIEKGFFVDEGLIIEPIVFDSTNQMVGAIVSGHLDSSLGGANLQTIFSVEEKLPGSIKIFSTLDLEEDSLFTCVIVKENSKIQSIKDLEDLSAATLPGTFAPLWIKASLKQFNLNISNIELIQIAPNLQLAALESSQVDSLFTVEPVCSFSLNKGIGKIIYKDPMNDLTNVFAANIVSSDFAEDNPLVMEQLIRASDKIVDFIRANPKEAIEIMAKYTGYENDLIQGMELPSFSKSTELNIAELQELASIFYSEEILKERIVVEDMILS